ncbi:MAG: T9SS type A sorting domain-containing protein [Chitinophagaceae bacterium]|nr:T9SS type A sorting domain-containing protein [Chitinophagaceae bacterium]
MKLFITLTKHSLVLAITMFTALYTYAGKSPSTNFDTTPATVLADGSKVQCTSFTGTFYERGIILSWSAIVEAADSYFEVERSFDKSNFTTAGLVLDAESATDNNKNFRFKDNAAALKDKAIVYYRLKLIDKDGTTHYSGVLTVGYILKEAEDLQATPNPSNQVVKISFKANAAEVANVRLVNNEGTIVLSKQAAVKEGVNTLSINDLANIPSGIYVVQVLVNNKIIGSQKILKQ